MSWLARLPATTLERKGRTGSCLPSALFLSLATCSTALFCCSDCSSCLCGGPTDTTKPCWASLMARRRITVASSVTTSARWLLFSSCAIQMSRYEFAPYTVVL